MRSVNVVQSFRELTASKKDFEETQRLRQYGFWDVVGISLRKELEMVSPGAVEMGTASMTATEKCVESK